MMLTVLLSLSWMVSGSPKSPTPATLAGHEFLSAPGREWRLLWSDEFDGTTLDTRKWSIGLSWTGDDGSNRHHNSQYASVITDSDVIVQGGLLRLRTTATPAKSPSGKMYDFTEGLVQSNGKFAAKYGYYEIRAQVPGGSGPGMWPAFWMLSEGWPPEMDIAEFWTGDNRFHQGLAFRKEAGSVGWDDTNSHSPLLSGFHTYGMEWGPGYQIYNVDGVTKWICHGPQVPAVPMYILLNSGIESAHKPNASTAFPNYFDIDYVRVYQPKSWPLVHDASFESPQALSWWGKWNDVSMVDHDAHSAKHALRIGGSAGSSEQTIYGLRPNTNYTLTGWAKLAGTDGEARIGVKEYGGAELSCAIKTLRYSRGTVRFRTGGKDSSATIYCYKPSGSAEAYFDDIEVSRQQ